MSDQRLFQLEVDGVDAGFRITGVKGKESLHAPFSFEIGCIPAGPDGAPVDGEAVAKAILTQPARLSLALDDGSERVVHGVIDRVVDASGSWVLGLVARVAILADTLDHRVFVDEDAMAIAEQVLTRSSFTVEKRCKRALVKRAQCVQAFESDLDFISRILAEEGIVWFCHPTEKDTLVFADNSSAFTDIAGGPVVVREGGGLAAGTSVYRTRLSRKVASDRVTLRDHDFEKPHVDLTVEEHTAEGRLERYEYHSRFTTPNVGRALARIRLDQLRADEASLSGDTDSRRFVPGEVVTIEGGPISGVDGRWLLVDVEHTVKGLGVEAHKPRYSAHFSAVPAAAGFRRTPAPAPGLGGVQTMDVTGPPGAEIHPDKYGRIKGHFRWDRLRPRDDTSSSWLRVIQPPTSGGFFLPRMGWEMLTGFWGGSGEAPIIMGRLYNGIAPPPSGLPGKKVVSEIGTATTPGGGGGNRVAMDDTAGNEGMAFHASKDFNEKTTKDKVTTITADDIHSVGANRTVIVGQVHGVNVTGAQSYTVAATRTVNVTGNLVTNAGSEAVAIGGARVFNVGGDSTTDSATLSRVVGAAKAEACIESQSILVTGASSRLIGASWGQLSGISASISVGGVSTEEVGGAKNIKALSYGLKVKGTLTETYGSRTVTSGADVNEVFNTTASYDIGGSATFKGADVLIVGTSSVTIKADGITITITDGEVKIDGKFESSQASVDKDAEDYD